MSPPKSPPKSPAPTQTRAQRRLGRYELISCGLHGHTLVGLDVKTITAEDDDIVRERERAALAPLLAL